MERGELGRIEAEELSVSTLWGEFRSWETPGRHGAVSKTHAHRDRLEAAE